MEPRSLLRRGNQLIFQWPPTLVHLATNNFVGWCIHKAELADGEMIVLVANRRAKGSALYGAEHIEIAGSGVGIEHGAGLIVGEVREGLFMLRLREEQAGGCITGEFRTQARTRLRGTGADSLGDLGGRCVQACTKVLRVKLRDGEDADAALLTPGPAGEPVAGAVRCRG